MANSADWFARKMGLAPQAPPPQQHEYQPQYHQQPQVQQQPQQYYQPQPQPASGQQVFEAFKNGQATLMDVVGAYRGGKAAKTERSSCPECGESTLFFTRKGMKTRAGAAPAPLCMNCGYNGMFEQFGTHGVAEGDSDGEFD